MNNGVRYDSHKRIAIRRDTKFLSLFLSFWGQKFTCCSLSKKKTSGRRRQNVDKRDLFIDVKYVRFRRKALSVCVYFDAALQRHEIVSPATICVAYCSRFDISEGMCFEKIFLCSKLFERIVCFTLHIYDQVRSLYNIIKKCSSVCLLNYRIWRHPANRQH